LVVYADSSFLVSLYVEDGNTIEARDYLAANVGPIQLTSFSRSEAGHALRTLVFRKLISLEELTRCLLILERDLTEGLYQLQPLRADDLFAKASQLSRRHAAEVGVRYLDMLHVAAALLINAKRFLTFDLRQRKLAKTVGLDVKI
jgi:predicted nucleic acid-binding protein